MNHVEVDLSDEAIVTKPRRRRVKIGDKTHYVKEMPIYPWACFEHYEEDPGKVMLCLAHNKVRLLITNEQSLELGKMFAESQILVG